MTDIAKKFAGYTLNDCVKYIRDLNNSEAECEEIIQGLVDLSWDRAWNKAINLQNEALAINNGGKK
jgi:hypothetical protein